MLDQLSKGVGIQGRALRTWMSHLDFWQDVQALHAVPVAEPLVSGLRQPEMEKQVRLESDE